MKLPRVLLPLAFVVLAASAHAHPGHDGDHGLTWDFGHLAAHPGATMLWLAIFAFAVWLVVHRVQADRALARQSLRTSQDKRG